MASPPDASRVRGLRGSRLLEDAHTLALAQAMLDLRKQYRLRVRRAARLELLRAAESSAGASDSPAPDTPSPLALKRRRVDLAATGEPSSPASDLSGGVGSHRVRSAHPTRHVRPARASSQRGRGRPAMGPVEDPGDRPRRRPRSEGVDSSVGPAPAPGVALSATAAAPWGVPGFVVVLARDGRSFERCSVLGHRSGEVRVRRSDGIVWVSLRDAFADVEPAMSQVCPRPCPPF